MLVGDEIASMLELIDISDRLINMSSSSQMDISKSPQAVLRDPSSGREKILAVGADLLASRGLAEVNTNTIARAAGVGVGTFYNHFDDKFALQRELMSRGLALLQEALSRASQASRGEPVERQVRASVAAFVDFAQAFPALYRVIFAGGESQSRTGRPGVGFSARALENRLAELQRDQRLEASLDVGLAARTFNAGQGQIVLWWLENSQAPPVGPLIETLVRLHPAVACRR